MPTLVIVNLDEEAAILEESARRVEHMVVRDNSELGKSLRRKATQLRRIAVAFREIAERHGDGKRANAKAAKAS